MTEQHDHDESEVSIEIDLTEAIEAAAIALYEAGDEYDFLVPFSQLPQDDRDGYEGAASIVLEAALPSVSQQLFEALEQAE